MNEKTIRKLQGKKLSALVKKYGYRIDDFMDDEDNEMTQAQYEKLKNHRVDIEILANDFNYNYIIRVGNFEAWCIFDY